MKENRNRWWVAVSVPVLAVLVVMLSSTWTPVRADPPVCLTYSNEAGNCNGCVDPGMQCPYYLDGGLCGLTRTKCCTCKPAEGGGGEG